MGTILGWFGVRDIGASRVIEELRATCAIASREDIPEMFRVFEQVPPRKGLSFWRKQAPTWTLVLLEGSGSEYLPADSAPTWAQALSLRFSCSSISFFLLSNTWSYAVFQNGKEVVAQESYTLPVPEVYGDRERGGEVLGIDSALFDKYVKDDRDEPFPGDKFAPSDAWVHTDFARHIGLIYPDDSLEGTVYVPSATELQSAGAEWKGLPARLKVREPPPHPFAKGEELDLDNFPAGDDPF